MPAELRLLGGRRPDLVAVHVVPPRNPALPIDTPSHVNNAELGHWPCAIVNVTRALNVWVAVP